MKKLFRTSRAGGVDPLPLPDHQHSSTTSPIPPLPLVPQPAPIKKGIAAILPENPDHAKRKHHLSQGSVIPFPLEPVGRGAERDQYATIVPPTHRTLQQSQPGALATTVRNRERGRGTPTPTLMDIRQMEDSVYPDRIAIPLPQPVSRSRAGTGSGGAPSPEGWTVIPPPPPSRGHLGNGPDPPFPPSIPVPLSTPPTTQPGFYLPPGAGPPSPQFRPATPTRLGHISQTSLGAYDPDGYVSGRSRGYSSASQSGRGSDHEGSVHLASPLAKAPQTSRSPLANPYTPELPGTVVFPAPHHYTTVPVPPMPNPWSSISPNTGVAQPTSRGTPRESPRDTPTPVDSEAPREKKRFWGVAWGGDRNRKNKDIDKDSSQRASFDEPSRPSVDDWRGDADISAHGHSSIGHGPSSIGHGGEEHSRGRMLGFDFVRRDQDVNEASDVTTAIRLLCASRNPSVNAFLDVCERLNHSDSPESVGKEAARCLRKEFKYGGEDQKRTASRIWLIMMRNVSIKGFRHHATNKKFMATLESIILAPPGKPMVSTSTHRLLVDTISGLSYQYGMEKGCEGLLDLWKKIKMPQEPEFGVPLPPDHQLYNPEVSQPPTAQERTAVFAVPPPPPTNYSAPASPLPSRPFSRLHSEPHLDRSTQSPTGFGPSYAHLADHSEDVRRLVNESMAAKESAGVLSEALVYTRPEELEYKTVIKEFYTKCFLAHESLINQMDWAQSEAIKSRHLLEASENHNELLETPEENALALLFEAHGLLTEALRHHDDLEKMAADDRELREVQERSKKETRMDRKYGMLASEPRTTASSSRSPSPARRIPLSGFVGSPRELDAILPERLGVEQLRSRSPSPDRRLPRPPKLSDSPSRGSSPSGRARIPGPRPLPNPLRSTQSPSSQSLSSVAHDLPSRGDSGSTHDGMAGSGGSGAEGDADGEDDLIALVRPSRKALGKRRAIVDDDNTFDPDEMFGTKNPTTAQDSSSEESVTPDDIFFSKPIVYAYDAYQEKLAHEAAAASTSTSDGVGSAGSAEGQLVTELPPR